jgi:hypothetical protein
VRFLWNYQRIGVKEVTKLFIVERKDGPSYWRSTYVLPEGREVDVKDLPTGAMWRCQCHAGRGWSIALPHRNPDPDWARFWCTLDGTDQGKGWEVYGEAPNLTVSPSINCLEPGGWHGHIVNGEITDGSYN